MNQHNNNNHQQTAAVIAECFAGILGTCLRLWFLNSLARRFADEEMRSLKKPVQRFVWERLNDRYALDRIIINSMIIIFSLEL